VFVSGDAWHLPAPPFLFLERSSVLNSLDWNKAFPIAGVTRIDLLKWGVPEEQVAQLTDEDMTSIAQRMAGLYLADERGFWSDLEYVTQGMLPKKEQSSDWNKEFPLNSVSRADLKEAGFSDEQIAFISDEDMKAIANKMADWYDENGFWDDLLAITEALLEERKQANG
jgi:hypothetical protein